MLKYSLRKQEIFRSVVRRLTNCQNTSLRYWNHWLTNPDTNYSPPKPLSTPSRQHKYLTITNWCLLMWNHCSLVFHFNWLSTALKPPSTTPLYNCHYLPTTLWTCWTSALRLLTFSTTVNTTNSYTGQLWVHRFPLLLPKSLCKTSRNKPWQVTNEQYHSGYATLTILSQLYTKTKSTIFTNISTDKTPTFSLPRRSRTMVRFLFLTAWSFVTTTDYRRRFTENPPTLTDSLTNHLKTLRHTRLQQYGP